MPIWFCRYCNFSNTQKVSFFVVIKDFILDILSLRGPRGAMVFYRQGVKGVDKKGNEVKYDYKNKIENAIFPGS